MNRFQARLGFAEVVAVLLCVAQAAVAGDLDPPGTPAPTPNAAEPRTPIPTPGESVTFPITITESGSYYLTQNLTVPDSTDCIVIEADHVTLDLNGFTLRNTAGNTTGAHGVSCESHLNVTVRNGNIVGFYAGVMTSTCSNVLVEDIRTQSCRHRGISLGINSSTSVIVRRCHINQTGGSFNPDAGSEVHGLEVVGGDALIEGNFITNVLASPVQDSWGIYQFAGDAFVVSNRVMGAETGLRMNVSTEYRDNLTDDVTTDYDGGISRGNNF